MASGRVPAVVVGTYTMGLAIIRALGEEGVPVIAIYYDGRDMGYLSRYVVEKYKAPHPAKKETEFIALLEEIGTRYPMSVLFPASDASLVAISRHKSVLECYFRVACPDWKITELFIEKKNTYALAEAVGVPAPKTVVPKCIEDVKRYAESAMYPCLVKPNEGHIYNALFGKKMSLVKNSEELIDSYLKAHAAGLEVMLQEFIPGEDAQGVNYNAYYINGKPVVEFTAQKVRSAPPQTGSPCLVISSQNDEVVQLGRDILLAMGFTGFACTEFKKDPRDGVYKLMEVNGRHNLSGLLAVRAGLNFPYLHYRHLTCEEIPTANGYKIGIAWIDLTRDLYFGAKQWIKDLDSLRRFFIPYRKPRTFAILDFKDPLPFLKRCWNLLTEQFDGKHAEVEKQQTKSDLASAD
ncbi:MAG: hypothetical protein EHM41_12580 [Chloroflexi bacterium]|nr:MAG: hypothetical protein EHM41_12580 [Chloroflexota bacterium]